MSLEVFPVTYEWEVDGAKVTLGLDRETAEAIAGWSTSQALLNLGAEAPALQEALRKYLGLGD